MGSRIEVFFWSDVGGVWVANNLSLGGSPAGRGRRPLHGKQEVLSDVGGVSSKQ